MSNFTFVDESEVPPPEKGRNTLYREFAQALRENPGKWALWPRELKSKQIAQAAAANVNRGTSSFPKGEFEAMSRGTTVYARFVGGDAS